MCDSFHCYGEKYVNGDVKRKINFEMLGHAI